jgi:hypothetical protein
MGISKNAPVAILAGLNIRRAHLGRTHAARLAGRDSADGTGFACSRNGDSADLARPKDRPSPSLSRADPHEEWKYTTNGQSGVALLVGLKLVCWHCHAVEHFGGTGAKASSGEVPERAIEDTINHFCRVNEVRDATGQANAPYDHSLMNLGSPNLTRRSPSRGV